MTSLGSSTGGDVSARAMQAAIRAGLETAVRRRVSTVTVDREGPVNLSDPLTPAPEPWEHVLSLIHI